MEKEFQDSKVNRREKQMYNLIFVFFERKKEYEKREKRVESGEKMNQTSLKCTEKKFKKNSST